MMQTGWLVHALLTLEMALLQLVSGSAVQEHHYGGGGVAVAVRVGLAEAELACYSTRMLCDMHIP